MKILLIFNKGQKADLKLMVQLHDKKLIEKIRTLLLKRKEKKVFDLLLTKAEVCEYIPPGRKVPLDPEHILVEDILEG
jgi:hypothetical protein